ncbi:MAG TPA: hypothetical protein VN829_04230 [Dongiaceae bacterium]|nr:hypothetical protein [Dongiaceae bacterium]
MYSNDTKDQFAELRAKGLSLSRIATDIHVSQRTLVDWNRQLAPDIRALRAVHLEALHEQTLASREADLARLAKVQANVETAITERDFSWVDSDKLIRIYLDLRHEIRDLRAADLSPLYEPDNPNLNLNPNPNPPASDPPTQDPPPITAASPPISPLLQQTTDSIPHSSPLSEAKSRLVGAFPTPHSALPTSADPCHQCQPWLNHAAAQFARRLQVSLASAMSRAASGIPNLSPLLSACSAHFAVIAFLAASLLSVLSASASSMPLGTPLRAPEAAPVSLRHALTLHAPRPTPCSPAVPLFRITSAQLPPHFLALAIHNPRRINHLCIPASPPGAILLHPRNPSFPWLPSVQPVPGRHALTLSRSTLLPAPPPGAILYHPTTPSFPSFPSVQPVPAPRCNSAPPQ